MISYIMIKADWTTCPAILGKSRQYCYNDEEFHAHLSENFVDIFSSDILVRTSDGSDSLHY